MLNIMYNKWYIKNRYLNNQMSISIKYNLTQ